MHRTYPLLNAIKESHIEITFNNGNVTVSRGSNNVTALGHYYWSMMLIYF